jgi:hypothetical protein
MDIIGLVILAFFGIVSAYSLWQLSKAMYHLRLIVANYRADLDVMVTHLDRLQRLHAQEEDEKGAQSSAYQ